MPQTGSLATRVSAVSVCPPDDDGFDGFCFISHSASNGQPAIDVTRRRHDSQVQTVCHQCKTLRYPRRLPPRSTTKGNLAYASILPQPRSFMAAAPQDLLNQSLFSSLVPAANTLIPSAIASARIRILLSVIEKEIGTATQLLPVKRSPASPTRIVCWHWPQINLPSLR